MSLKEVSPEEFYKASIGMQNDYINAKEFEALITVDQSLIVIDLRSPNRVEDKIHENYIHISMEDMVSENLEKLIPVKSTSIVLICDQSYGMSRMVALTDYAYPTLKLMGYSDLKILHEW